MVKKTTIRENIKQLCKLYNNAPTPKYELYYAKLAIIELCGWIEESQDDIVRRCAKKNLKEIANIKTVESTIKTNYGFQYDRACKIDCVSGKNRLKSDLTGGTDGHYRRTARCLDERLQEARRPDW